MVTWENGKLIQRPIEEVKSLRKNQKEFNMPKDHFQLESGKFEIELLRRNGLNDFKLCLRNHAVVINYCAETKIFSVSRENWVTKKKESKSKEIQSLLQLSIFSDASTIEIFVNNGEYVFSLRYFTDEKQLGSEYSGLEQDEKLIYFEF